MTEPAPFSFSLLATAVVVLGPTLGPYTLVLFAAGAGTAMALAATPTATRLEGIRFIVLGTFVSLLLTGPAAWLIEKYTDVPGNVALIPVAFVLGLLRGRLYPLITQLADVVATFAASLASAVANRKGGGQ